LDVSPWSEVAFVILILVWFGKKSGLKKIGEDGLAWNWIIIILCKNKYNIRV
jgi:hypothetical protein